MLIYKVNSIEHFVSTNINNNRINGIHDIEMKLDSNYNLSREIVHNHKS